MPADRSAGQQSPDWAAAIQRTLAAVDDLKARVDALQDGPKDDSPAATVATLPHGMEAWVYAVAGINTALDHLAAWRHLHATGMQPPFAHWTLIRVAVEGASTARWLCDPKASNEQRRNRGFGAAVADLEQRKSWEERVRKAMPNAPQPEVSARARLDELFRSGIKGTRLREATELVTLYCPDAKGIDAGALYRAVSSYAHSKMWALGHLGELEVQSTTVSHMTGVSRTKVHAPSDIVWLITDWTVNSVGLAVDDFVTYSTRPV